MNKSTCFLLPSFALDHDWSSVFPSGKISPWTGRFYSLLDPSYAKNNIPIIASVSEHQPTTWSSYYFDLQLLVFMFPGKCTLSRNTVWYCKICWVLTDSYLYFYYSRSLLLFQQPVGCQDLHHYVWSNQHVLLSCHGVSFVEPHSSLLIYSIFLLGFVPFQHWHIHSIKHNWSKTCIQRSQLAPSL